MKCVANQLGGGTRGLVSSGLGPAQKIDLAVRVTAVSDLVCLRVYRVERAVYSLTVAGGVVDVPQNEDAMKKTAKRVPKKRIVQKFKLDPYQGMGPLVAGLVPPSGYRLKDAKRNQKGEVTVTYLLEEIDG